MRRLNHRSERGATAVVIALLMFVMLGFTALAVDVGVLWSDRKQLQNGADAGALAIAQQCADGLCPLTPDDEAFHYVNANEKPQGLTELAGSATGATEGTRGTVRVVASATRPHWFAPVIEITSSGVSAAAEASWGPVGGTVTPPFAFSVCEFAKQTNPEWDGGALPDEPVSDVTIYFSKSSNVDPSKVKKEDDPVPCLYKGQDENYVPGGFGWLATVDNSTCETATISLDDNVWLPSSTGKAIPSGCSPDYLAKFLDADHILIPLFDASNELSGNNAQYRLYGFAAFKVLSYHLGNQTSLCGSVNPAIYPVTCTGDDRYIRGSFLKYVSLQDAEISDDEDAPNTGAIVVKLTK